MDFSSAVYERRKFHTKFSTPAHPYYVLFHNQFRNHLDSPEAVCKMNQLVDCFEHANEYPRPPSLLYHQTYDHLLDALKRRLDKREEDLFCSDVDASLHVLRYKDPSGSFVEENVKSYDGLRAHFGFKQGQLQPDEDAESQFM